jgi:hypothetical protein
MSKQMFEKPKEWSNDIEDFTEPDIYGFSLRHRLTFPVSEDFGRQNFEKTKIKLAECAIDIFKELEGKDDEDLMYACEKVSKMYLWREERINASRCDTSDPAG